ncbi:phage head-tail adapter protein [Evansella clarkii]|uniref:phage head-tail adapter protein n=1 Tax=Evansella clarkii TaxID=79879 RepID=UPI000B451259|nr:phage head-tail adapter protein [Evansella clarkii]
MKRRIQKPIHEVFNDGFLEYGLNEVQRNERGKRIGEKFSYIGTLAFKLMDAREEDYQLAHAMGATLDLKLKTHFPPSFRTKAKSRLACKIEGSNFDVIKVDWDSGRRYLYFYLQEVRAADE